MAGDPLYEPLGMERREPPETSRPRRWPLWLGALGGVAVLAVVASMAAARRDRGPDPAVAVVAIDPAPTGSTGSTAVVAPLAAPAAAAVKVVSLDPQAPSVSGNTVEIQNGVKIVRFSPASSSAAITLPVEGAAASGLARALDPRLVEKTADGPLPRIGDDGRRPADVYGRPAAVVTGPRLALLLTGMGVDQVATADAARRLPADMSFAFVPGAPDGAAQVADVRRAGHEVFLDLTAAPDAVPRDGTAVLHRNMARFAGYAGALLDAAAAQTMVRDLTGRGIQPLFDAASPIGEGLAPTADMLIDSGGDAAALAGSLDRLVALARTRGSAVAVVRDGARAQPTLATLAAGLAAQGVTLVPVASLAAEQGRRASR